MTDALIVASHLPGEGHFRSERFEVVGVECRDPFDYWRGLASACEGSRPVINLEHDIEASDEHIAALLDCPESLCSWAYHAHWASTGLPREIIAAGAGARDVAAQPDAYYLQGGEQWAQWSAIGLVKIAAAARTGPLRREPWNRLELAVEDAVQGPWHVHGNAVGGADLVPHHHW